MEAHHYVSQLNKYIHQEIIFDGNEKNAKIMGVTSFQKSFFKPWTKKKRSSGIHHYEVKSAALIAPRISDVAEHELMKNLVSKNN